ncbi:MAG: hypothetical protein U9O06_14810 [Euryarchaeota archaeon]|nr:hypothetical protein [Euryarchaeota archaeon]
MTSAAFQSSVQPSTNFQIVPENAELTVRRLEKEVDYNNLDGNASWNESEITDFGNVTGQQGSPVVAHINDSTDGSLGAQLAFNNSNGSDYNQYEYDPLNESGQWGFFEIANLGETTETVGITFGYDSDNVAATVEDGDSAILEESEVANMFTFNAATSEAGEISPNQSNPGEPAGSVDIGPGDVEIIGLTINITTDVYEAIQEAAGGAFSATEPSIQLLESITVGTDF